MLPGLAPFEKIFSISFSFRGLSNPCLDFLVVSAPSSPFRFPFSLCTNLVSRPADFRVMEIFGGRGGRSLKEGKEAEMSPHHRPNPRRRLDRVQLPLSNVALSDKDC